MGSWSLSGWLPVDCVSVVKLERVEIAETDLCRDVCLVALDHGSGEWAVGLIAGDDLGCDVGGLNGSWGRRRAVSKSCGGGANEGGGDDCGQHF